MERTRIKLAVYVDLDPVPGAFHSADSARNIVANLLNQSIVHYHPTVSIESYSTQGLNTIERVGTDPGYTACSFALGNGQYCKVDSRTPHVHAKGGW